MTLRSGLQSAMVLLACLGGTGCITAPNIDPSRMTALQIRAIQTRQYDTPDSRAALKTVLNVLQDEGFLVDYGDLELGLLHGTKQINATAAQSFGTGPADLEMGPYFSGSGELVTIEVTANISAHGDGTRVRVSFARRYSNAHAGTYHSLPIIDAQFHQTFFAKLERSLFLQNEGL